MEVTVISKPEVKGVGMAWSGTYEQAGAGEIRHVIHKLHQRFNEVPRVINQHALLAPSYHPQSDGFTIYLLAEVSEFGATPQGMEAKTIPALTYAMYQHQKGKDIDGSYRHILEWIHEEGYQAIEGGDIPRHFELYPLTQDPFEDEPEFTIMIPIQKVTGVVG